MQGGEEAGDPVAAGRGGGDVFVLRRDEEGCAEEGAVVEGRGRGVAFGVVDGVGLGVLQWGGGG